MYDVKRTHSKLGRSNPEKDTTLESFDNITDARNRLSSLTSPNMEGGIYINLTQASINKEYK